MLGPVHLNFSVSPVGGGPRLTIDEMVTLQWNLSPSLDSPTGPVGPSSTSQEFPGMLVNHNTSFSGQVDTLFHVVGQELQPDGGRSNWNSQSGMWNWSWRTCPACTLFGQAGGISVASLPNLKRSLDVPGLPLAVVQVSDYAGAPATTLFTATLDGGVREFYGPPQPLLRGTPVFDGRVVRLFTTDAGTLSSSFYSTMTNTWSAPSVVSAPSLWQPGFALAAATTSQGTYVAYDTGDGVHAVTLHGDVPTREIVLPLGSLDNARMVTWRDNALLFSMHDGVDCSRDGGITRCLDLMNLSDGGLITFDEEFLTGFDVASDGRVLYMLATIGPAANGRVELRRTFVVPPAGPDAGTDQIQLDWGCSVRQPELRVGKGGLHAVWVTDCPQPHFRARFVE
jgi:hypothetical protein